MTQWENFDRPDETISSGRFDDIDEMMEPPEIPDQEPTKPDASILDPKKKSRKAAEYSKKVKKVFGFATRAALMRPSTVPDAATFLLYGPKVSNALGDLAAEHEGILAAVDMAENLVDSPVLAAVAAVGPMLIQLARNHEPVLAPAPRKFKIPVLNRVIGLPKVGIKLGVFRNLANDPDNLVQYVLGDPDVQAALKKNGIILAS